MKTLLVEIRTEELPPEQLWRLADAFADALLAQLKTDGFAGDDANRRIYQGQTQRLATPRRLAALLENIHHQSIPKTVVQRGPQLAACQDAAGKPSKALMGFMHSVAVNSERDLIHIKDKDKIYVAYQKTQPPRKLADYLAAMVEAILLNLPAPRLMRWGQYEFKFIRPIRGILMMHGETIINGTVMNIAADKQTYGHRLHKAAVVLSQANNYERDMHQAQVMVDMNQRAMHIKQQINTLCDSIAAEGIRIYGVASTDDSLTMAISESVNQLAWSPSGQTLLREMTAMCEFPTVYHRQIDTAFLSLPAQCVSTCMATHQRFFPLYNNVTGQLLADYFLVTDNAPASAEDMLRGYDAVLRARLNDVQFYYHKDKQHSLSTYTDKLKTIVFHHKLGSQYDRIKRVCQIAMAALTAVSDVSESAIKQQAINIQAALPTLMVNEYPQLQNYMAIQYFEKGEYFALIRCCYEMEKLSAMFAIGEIATGSKDPHGLRKCAYAIAQALLDKNDGALRQVESIRHFIDCTLMTLAETLTAQPPPALAETIYDFIMERVRFILSETAVETSVIDSILTTKPDELISCWDKIVGIQEFKQTQAAELTILVAANKRINNIFHKSPIAINQLPLPQEHLFTHDSERDLYRIIQHVQQQTQQHINAANYQQALKILATSATAVDSFFTHVMVNDDNDNIRHNRFALLKMLRQLLNQVADIAKLGV